MATVVAGRFEDLVGIGLSVVIEDDPNLDLVARDVPLSQLDSVVARHSPAVVLLNFSALSGPADLLALHQRLPDARILVLATRPTATECTQMLSFGATGCLSKETEARDIVSAIHLASRGMHVLPRSAAAGGGVDQLGIEGNELTAREAEVLELLQDGRTNAEIATELAIGIETVRTHARNIYRKLGVPSRRELARMAQQEPVVVDDERRPVPTG
jgi:NarL family two-component system response regulator LiaR